jgi:hypothetical protein
MPRIKEIAVKLLGKKIESYISPISKFLSFLLYKLIECCVCVYIYI